MNNQEMDWETLHTHMHAHTQTYGKKLVLTMYKQLSQFNNKKKHPSPQKRAKYLNRHFTKDMWIANKHMKKCSTSLVIMHYKLNHEISTKMDRIKKTDIKCGWGGLDGAT